MKYLALCALFLCGCGDGRIVRAINGQAAAGASYPAFVPHHGSGQHSHGIPPIPEIPSLSPEADAEKADSDKWYRDFDQRIEAESQASKVQALEDRLNDIENRHPGL